MDTNVPYVECLCREHTGDNDKCPRHNICGGPMPDIETIRERLKASAGLGEYDAHGRYPPIESSDSTSENT